MAYVKKNVVTEGLSGKLGNTIVFRLVSEVTVAMYNKAGALVEEGPATLHINGTDWVYTTQLQNANVAGSKLVVHASDLPGNTLQKEVIFA